MSATDPAAHFFFELKPRLAAKVGAGGVSSPSATTIPHTFVGLTEGNAYVVTANRTDSTGTTKYPLNSTETFIGKVSGSNFINCVRNLEGVAQAWAADTVLEILVSATGWNKLLEGLAVEHNQDGTHNLPTFPTKAGVQSSSYVYADDSGSNDTYVIALTPAIADYATGMEIAFKANTTNTGPCTLNVNTKGAISLKIYKDGVKIDPPNNYINAGQIVKVVYDGTDFQILSLVNSDGWVDLTDGATINIDLSLGRKFRIKALGGNRTLTVSNIPKPGCVFLLEIGQDGTGTRLISVWFTGDSTFATTDVNAGTDIITVGTDIPTGTPIKFSSTGTAPAGLTAGTKYYAIRQSTTTIKVASSLANAQAGTAIDITDQGSGTHTILRLIRWKADTEPTLSTGKYKVDTLGFTVIEEKAFRGYTVGMDG